MPGLSYHTATSARFPTIVGGVIHAVGLTNGLERRSAKLASVAAAR